MYIYIHIYMKMCIRYITNWTLNILNTLNTLFYISIFLYFIQYKMLYYIFIFPPFFPLSFLASLLSLSLSLVCVCIFVHVWVNGCAPVNVCDSHCLRSDDNFKESNFSFHYVNNRNWTLYVYLPASTLTLCTILLVHEFLFKMLVPLYIPPFHAHSYALSFVKMKLNILFLATCKNLTEVEDEWTCCTWYEIHMTTEVVADAWCEEKGYVIQISGG